MPIFTVNLQEIRKSRVTAVASARKVATETLTKACFFTGIRNEVFTFTVYLQGISKGVFTFPVNLQGIRKEVFTFTVNLQVFAHSYCGVGKARVDTVSSRFVEAKWHVLHIFGILHERCRLFGGVILHVKKP